MKTEDLQQPAGKKPDSQPPAEKKQIGHHFLWTGIVVVCLIGYILMRVLITPTRPVTDFFSILEEHGYQPNIGFSGNYSPGNIVQLSEKGNDGKERPLVPPLVILWRDQCFPDKNFRESLYVLPETSGKSTTQLNLGAETISKAVPELQLDSRIALNYNLRFEDTRVLSYAKLDLSQQFSEPCVRMLEQELSLGNMAEWYGVILEAVVSDGMSFTIDWQENTATETRTRVTKKAENTLATMVTQQNDVGSTLTGSVSLAGDSQKRTVLKADGQIIVGYRTRRLQPVHAE